MASMGPRFENRGKVFGRRGKNKLTLLLQWGHGSKTVERYNVEPMSRIEKSASMGPRFENRGKGPAEACKKGRQIALQWGHGSKTVESSYMTGPTNC